GVPCVLVEQTDGALMHPRANTVNSRTMEFCRRWGIAERVKNSGTPPGFPADIVYLTSFPGHAIARINRPTYGGTQPLDTASDQERGKAAFYSFADADGCSKTLVAVDGKELWRLGIDFGK